MSCEGCPSQGKCGKNSETCGIQSNPDNHIKNIITVMSGKGGVGKSTVTVMLAKAMAKKGLKVGIMDADITGPSIPRLLALTNQHAYGNEKQQLIPIESKEGIKVMSLNFLVQSESDPVIWRGPVIGGVVKQFYTDVVWGDLDVLLIDMPPGTGDVALTIMQSIPVQGVVMVSTPQPMVSMIVEKACHMCEKMEVKVLGIIVFVHFSPTLVTIQEHFFNLCDFKRSFHGFHPFLYIFGKALSQLCLSHSIAQSFP